MENIIEFWIKLKVVSSTWPGMGDSFFKLKKKKIVREQDWSSVTFMHELRDPSLLFLYASPLFLHFPSLASNSTKNFPSQRKITVSKTGRYRTLHTVQEIQSILICEGFIMVVYQKIFGSIKNSQYICFKNNTAQLSFIYYITEIGAMLEFFQFTKAPWRRFKSFRQNSDIQIILIGVLTWVSMRKFFFTILNYLEKLVILSWKMICDKFLYQ